MFSKVVTPFHYGYWVLDNDLESLPYPVYKTELFCIFSYYTSVLFLRLTLQPRIYFMYMTWGRN